MLSLDGEGKMNIGEKERPFRIDFYQIRTYCELKECEMHEYQADFAKLKGGGMQSAGFLIDLLYSALASGAKANKLKVDFTDYEVTNWFMNLGEGEMDKFYKVLTDLGKSAPADEPKKQKGQMVK